MPHELRPSQALRLWRDVTFDLVRDGQPDLSARQMAAIAHAATLTTRVPILHFFDGFRTSHEIAKIEPLDDETLRSLISAAAIAAVRERAMTPDRPVLRGTAQNPDAFFQAREACNPFYEAFPTVLRQTLEHFVELTGRRYRLFDYVGHPEAERVIVTMGSSAECVHETVEWLQNRGERVGVLKVRLFRPWIVADFAAGSRPARRRCSIRFRRPRR